MARAMVSASTGAINSVLAKLNILLLGDGFKLHKVVKNELRFLWNELTTMRDVLDNLANDEDLDPLVKGWMKQVRDLTYDLEDSLDRFMLPDPVLDFNNRGSFIKKVSRRLETLRVRDKITIDIKELRAQVVEASERRSRYKLDSVGADQPSSARPRLHAHSMSSNFVQIDPRLHAPGDSLVDTQGRKENLIDCLAVDGEQNLKVVSIVGFGGLGKTTLAREVGRSLQGSFGCHIFVSLPQRPSTRMILTSILSQLRAQEYTSGECTVVQLIDQTRELLQDKRYFVIIDDLWDVQAWQIIRCALPENQCGSRILVTTRIFDVAMACCYSKEDHIFRLSPLSHDESRKLFFRRIYHPENCCPSHLDEISDQILKSCAGLPLGINVIAGMLVNKPGTVEEWKIAQDSIGSGNGLQGIRKMLNFCYVDLPIHLKTCLLYLCVFPEDYVIDRVRLIRRWIAEGFVQEHGMSLEEAGESYFNELINRGLVQPVGIQYNGRIEACRVHDLILDFILFKSCEDNFLTVSDGSRYNLELQDKVRRLSLHFGHEGEGNFIPLATNCSHVRSLTIFMANKEMPNIASFRALRVLDLETSGELTEYLGNVGRLYLLRYMRLQTTRFMKLPEQIGELKYLQTLDLTRAMISRLPLSIVRLKQLTHLLVNNVKLPDGIGELQALQELSHIKVDSSNSVISLEALGSLTMLRVLGLTWSVTDTDTGKKSCADSLVSSLNKLGTSNLQALHIESSTGCSLDFLLDSLSTFYRLQEFRMTSDYYFPGAPKWMAYLVCLTLLEINIDVVGEEVLQILGKLPSLVVLLLSMESAGPEQRLVIRSSGFQYLKEFDLICWNSLSMLMFEPGTMPALQKLQLKFSVKGACVDDGFRCCIKHLASFTHLRVSIDCMGAETRKVAAVEDAINSAVNAHPNGPRLELQRYGLEIPVHGEGEDDHDDEIDIVVVDEDVKPTTES